MRLIIGQPQHTRPRALKTFISIRSGLSEQELDFIHGSQVEHKVRHGHFYFTDTQRMRRLGGAPSVNKASTFFARRIIAAILKLSYITI